MLAAGIPFPRGGKPRMKNKAEQFALDDHDGVKTDGGNKKSHKKKKLTKQSEISTRETPDVLIENLTMQSISPGMLLLGCVFEIQDYCLKLSLPGRLFGTVPITNISNKYTSLLKGFAENPDDEEVSTLQAIFHIGQTLPCKVMSTKSSESSKNHITLSVNPHDVNEALQLASLLHGMVLYCAVQSVEDHGYVMDIGIKDVPGFLSHSLAAQYIKAYNDGQSLAVGHLVPTVVNMPSLKKGKLRFGQAVTLTAEPTVVMKSKLNELSDVALDTFIPGTPVDAVIQKVTECGLVVDCLGFSGCIYKDHMKNKTGAVYKQGQSFQGTVLYSNPVTHVLHLTMHTIPSPKKIKKMFGGLKKWQVIDEAVVTAVHKSNVCLKLKDNVQGIAVKNELSDQPIENISKKFSIDDIVRCRVISLHYLDNIVAVSLKASTLGQTYVSHDDLTVGEMYEGKVKKLVRGGMVVVLSPGIQGFVRDIHMADVPLTKPEVMFPKGKKVKCKILGIDRSSSPPAISLTCKKGMLMTKVPILASYEEASAGVTTKGVIVNIRDNGLVLSFLNEVQGWVPSSEFGAYKILHPEKVFFKGQVVKCRVMNCYPEDKKLFLTLRIDSTKLFGDKDVSQNKFEVGKFVEVRVTKKTEKGLDVVVKGKKFQAFLPVLHLSDHVENCQSLLECYKEKDVINVLCFSSKGVPVVTMKSSLIEAAKNGVPRTQMSEYEEQTIIPVAVKHFAKYGMFVELGYNITGLVPNKYIADRKISQPEEAGFVPHQTLMGKIRKIEVERNRLELSTKMEDIYNNDYTYGLDLLQSYFDDASKIKQHYLSIDDVDVKSKLAKLSIGLVVSVKVTCITEIGMLCVLPDGLKGFATTYHCGTTKMEEGQDVHAVVLFVDIVNECVELSCQANILRNVSNLRDVDSSKVKVDQVIKGECVLIKKEFVILALGGHAVGRFAFVPARRAFNDLIGRGDLFSVGQHYHVVIKRIILGDIAIGILKQHVRNLNNENKVTVLKRKNEEAGVSAKKQKISAECSEDSVINESAEREQQNQADMNDTRKHDDNSKVSEIQDTGEIPELVIGKKYVATIKKIREFQMDILIKNRIPGRIHITKVAKDLTEGMKPFKKFAPGNEVQVWVIGFHSKKSHNFLALSHCKMKTYAECSLFKHPPRALNCTFKSGDKVTCVVKEVSNAGITVWLAPDVKGVLPLHHMNVDFGTLLKPSKHYHSGDILEAEVFEVSGEEIQLTQYHAWEPEPGRNVVGLVQIVSADTGMTICLPHGFSGTVHLTDLRDCYIPADRVLLPLLRKRIVFCHILDVNQNTRFCQLSIRASRLTAMCNKPKDPELVEEDIKPGVCVRGFVTSITNSAITVALSRSLEGTVSLMESDERSDILKNSVIGSVVNVKVLSCRNGEITLSVIPQVDKLSSSNGDSLETAKSKKERQKRSDTEEEGEDFLPAMQELECWATPVKSFPCLQVAKGYNFTVQNVSDLKRPAENSDDESDKEEEKRKKPRNADKSDNEKLVFKTENLLVDGNRTVQTAEDFEEILKQFPNSAGHWLNYIGFYLEQMEVDKARNVAERALKTISFREEQERLNVWIVYLNLENLYGSQESMHNVLERALQQNEPLKIYSVLVDIYLNSNKIEEAESLYQTMVKKFHLNKDVWIDFGLFYMKTGRPKLARQVMDRSLKSIDQKFHVDLIGKFAQLELKYGDSDLGKTMFDNILKNYSKRTDLWSVYIDLLIKLKQFDTVRNLFEELITKKMSLRKTKFFFKRYVTFERNYGTEETVNTVIKKAEECLKSDIVL